MATNTPTQSGIKKFEDTTIAFENMIVQVGRAISRAQREMDVTQIEFQKDVTKLLKANPEARLDIRPMNSYVMPETSLALKIGMTMTYPEGSSEPTLSAVPLNAATTSQNDVSVEAATEINLTFVSVPDTREEKEPEPSRLNETEVAAMIEEYGVDSFLQNNLSSLNRFMIYMPDDRMWIDVGLSAEEPAYMALVNDRVDEILEVVLKPHEINSADIAPVGVPLYSGVDIAQAKAGDIVTISGDNFATIGGQTILKVDSRPVPIVRFDMTTISFKFPGWVTNGDIEVITPLGSTLEAGLGAVTPLPSLLYVEPLKGYYDLATNTGSWVALYGANFTSNTIASFANGSAPKSTRLSSYNKLEIEVGPNAVSGPLYLSHTAAPGYSSYSQDLFIMMPRIERVSPRQGVVGETIAIKGNSLNEVTRLTIGDAEVLKADFILHTDDEIRFHLPPNAFDGRIGLFAGADAGATVPTVESRDIFYVVPKITGFSTDVVQHGQNITVNGEGLDPDPSMMTLLFEGSGGISEAPVLSVAADRSSLVTRIPNDAVTGYVMLIRKKIFSGQNAADTSNTTNNKVTVLTNGGLPGDLLFTDMFEGDLSAWTLDSGGWSLNSGRLVCDATLGKLTYPASGALALTDFMLYADVLAAASFGIYMPVGDATILGYELWVDLAGVNANNTIGGPAVIWREIRANSAHTATIAETPITVPEGTNCFVKFSLTGSTMSLNINQSATHVFSQDVSVDLAAVTVDSLSLLSESDVQLWDNVILMKGDFLAVQIPQLYSFGEIPQPPQYSEISITDFNPKTGPIGTEITLTGMGIDADTEVYFGTAKVAQTTVTVDGAGLATAVFLVPDGAKSGNIKLVGRGGVIAATTEAFILPPSISGFLPSTVKAGDRFTLMGENLPLDASVAEVAINGTPATILATTSSAMTILVPEGATSGTVRVTYLPLTWVDSTEVLSVVTETLMADLVATASHPDTVWKHSYTTFAFNGSDAAGTLVTARATQRMEDNSVYENVLILHPPTLDYGGLRGKYPAMDISAGSILRLTFGAALSDSAVANEALETNSVKYEVLFEESGTAQETVLLPRTLCGYDQALESFDVDLSPVASKNGSIILVVYAGDSGAFESGVLQAQVVTVV